MRSIAFATVDVFTNQRFGGNPLAVVPDAHGLSDEEMQKIAAEFGYSESTFVLPPTDPANTARVRIFTPTTEVPFAGHPNVGTAFVLAQQAERQGIKLDALRFEEEAGLVHVTIDRDTAGSTTGAAIVAPKPLHTGPTIDLDVIAACASIEVGAIATDRHPPLFASVGLTFAIAELGSLEALASAVPDTSAFRTADLRRAGDTGQFALFLYVPNGGSVEDGRLSVRARMFAPLDNVTEDPATGSASAALAALLADRSGVEAFTLSVEQGVEMGRRSLITVECRREADAPTRVEISGQCVSVMEGTMSV